MAAGLDRRKLELYLPASEAAIGQARAFVDRLEALDAPRRTLRFAVRLLVSELFTNAVKYGSRREGARVRLSVPSPTRTFAAEIGDQRPRLRRGEDDDARRRRRVGARARVPRRAREPWGVVHNGETCVWFELDY